MADSNTLKPERNVFIQNIPVDDALDRYRRRLQPALNRPAETIAIAAAIGRITATAVFARLSSPNSNQAAMDGIAVKSAVTAAARETSPLDLAAGDDFVWINTGQTVPAKFDAVIMIEDVVSNNEAHARIFAPATPWQHIRPIGEDIVATEMIVPSGHRLRPVDLAAALAGGVETVTVMKRPSVTVMPTGNEIVQDGDRLKVGTIRDTNSLMLAGMLAESGADATVTPVIGDQAEELRQAVREHLAKADMLLIIAGSSAGSKDFTAAVLADLGEVIVHGVAMKPGKPVVLAVVDGKPVIGIPGFPVSAYLAFDTFVRPVLDGFVRTVRPFETAVSARKIVSSVKSEEHVRVHLGWVDGRLIASPLSGGAGVLMSLVRADGIAVIPRAAEGIAAGAPLSVSLLKPLSDIKAKLFAVGSHDLVVDILSDLLPLASSHVGSQAGLLALKNREANIAPTHILDAAAGIYNEAAVRRYFPHDDMILIKGVSRIQGFIVLPGNPNGIAAIADLVRPGIRFVNRQRGAGTRILLDYLLQKEGFAADDVMGYERVMSTHMAVASAVAAGSADVGLGILSAANALGLDFVPLAGEDYDFLIYASALEDPRIEHFIEALRSDVFRARVLPLGGYGFERTGELVTIGGSL